MVSLITGSRLMAISGSFTRMRRRNSRSQGDEGEGIDDADLDNSVFDESKSSEDERHEGHNENNETGNGSGATGGSMGENIEKRRLKSHNSASGMSQADLRQTIRDVQMDPNIDGAEKAKRIQELMTFSWRKSQENMGDSLKRRSSQSSLRRLKSANNVRKGSGGQLVGRSQSGIFGSHGASSDCLMSEAKQSSSSRSSNQDDESVYDEEVETLEDDDDILQSFHDEEKGIMGCEHYQRNCLISAPCCDEFFPCRFCHNEEMDHEIDRYAVNRVKCMKCGNEQGLGKNCDRCGIEFARYFCEPCKFYDNKEDKKIYHCPHCNICRIGEGLGIDYFHCHRCNACMSITLREHKCVERSLESDCPVCHEFMFTSTTPVMFLPCGHCMHVKCYETYTTTNYVCPICSKSLGDMAAYFRRIDEMLENERMPDEYVGLRSRIFCADCELRSIAPYHFVYHKCSGCGSYNTKVLEQLPRESDEQEQKSR